MSDERYSHAVAVRHPDGHECLVARNSFVSNDQAVAVARAAANAWGTLYDSTVLDLEFCVGCETYFVANDDGYSYEPLEGFDLEFDWLEQPGVDPDNAHGLESSGEGSRESEWIESGEFLCSWCRESDEQSMSTVVRFTPEGSDGCRFGEWVRYLVVDGDTIDTGTPEWFDELFGTRSWVRTDAWRGYYETPAPGLESVTAGWVTGYPDESVAYKATAAELYEALSTGQIKPPVEVFWLFEPTANVFSTASEIFVRPGDREAFDRWLREVEIDPEDLNQAFS